MEVDGETHSVESVKEATRAMKHVNKDLGTDHALAHVLFVQPIQSSLTVECAV